PIHDHHVDGQDRAVTDSTDQRLVLQARNEEAGGTGAGVRLRALEGRVDGVSRVARLHKEQVRPRVDEKVNALLLCRVADGGDPPCLPADVVKAGPLHDAVFEVNPDNPQVEDAGDV